jgi:protein involved in polysaccharide export with SLBB domain
VLWNPGRFRRRIWLYGLLALLTYGLSGWAQIVPPSSSLTPGGESDLQSLFGKYSTSKTTAGVFFEGPINPDEYLVGPGDRLKLYFWVPRYAEYEMVVSGEGDVAIPMVGMVSLAGASLTEARSRIADAVSKGMRISRVTVTLTEPRQFRVHITGLVAMPGTYVVPATARVADAITMAGGLKRSVTFVAGDTVVTYLASQRRLLLRDPSGSERRADLLTFLRGGRTDANPYLRDGETIYVPPFEATDEQIGCFGAVNQGGLFEYLETDRLSDALALTGGLRVDADSSSLEIVGSNGTESRIDLRVNPATALTRPMDPGDRVYVAAFPDTSLNGSVTVVGEVARPGGYPIRIGETTVGEIVERAGGLLPSAAANSARLIRHADNDPVAQERARVTADLLRGTQTPVYPSDRGLAAEFSRWVYSTTVLDLGSPDSDRNGAELALHDGDSLEVPKGPIGVRVLGAVNKAGEVPWQPGENLFFYLAEAGGVNKGGWKGQTVVVKASNNSQLRYQSGLPIDPGDVIYVPLKPAAQTNWQIFKDVIAVAAQVATVVVVVQSIGK